jgi:opacity protein-like surface antigen
MQTPRTWFAQALVLSAALLPARSPASAESTAGRLAAYTEAGVAPFVVERYAAAHGFPSGFETMLRTRAIDRLRKRGVFEWVGEAVAPAPADTTAAGAAADAQSPATAPQRLDIHTTITHIDVPSTFARFFGARARVQGRFVCTDARTGRELLGFVKEGTFSGPVRPEQAAQEAGSNLVKALVEELAIATASVPGAPQGPASAPGWKRASPYGPWRGFLGVSGAGHQLTASEMKRVYGALGGVKLDYTYWFRPCWAGRAGLSFSSARTKVDVTDPAVKVENNSMDVLSVPATVEVLRRWRGGDWTREIGAYYGLGIALIENDETIRLRAVEPTLDTLDVKTGAAYYSYGVTFVAGHQFHVWDRFHGTLEVRWLQAQRGRFRDDADPKNAQEEQAYTEFKRLIHRPDYDVTGWQASLGVSWGK